MFFIKFTICICCIIGSVTAQKLCIIKVTGKRYRTKSHAYKVMEKCFVIQPFDNGIFDKRYEDIFEPAIKSAGFEAYRIDRDPSVRIPIEEIEKGISESAFCFAEITTDNPNVWY